MWTTPQFKFNDKQLIKCRFSIKGCSVSFVLTYTLFTIMHLNHSATSTVWHMDYKNVFTNCAPMELPNGLLTVLIYLINIFSASRFQVLKTTNTNLFSYNLWPLWDSNPEPPTLKVWCSTNWYKRSFYALSPRVH